MRTVDDRPLARPRSSFLTCGGQRCDDTVVAVPEPSRLPWRLVAVSTVIALSAAIGTYLLLDGDDAKVETAGIELTPEDEVPSADEAVFTTYEGEEVPLSSLDGMPTVINFFASTCTPCIKEMPAFEDVHQDLGDQVVFFGLAVQDRPEDAQALVDQTGVTYRTALDKDGSAIGALEGTLLPTTVLLDAEGEVVARHTGELEADELRTLLADELGIRS